MNFQSIVDSYNCYPEILGYDYFNKPAPEDLHKYDVVFIESDIPAPLKKTDDILIFHSHAMAGDGMHTWLQWDLSRINRFEPLPPRDIPTVGFVGRIPVFGEGKKKKLHVGFEHRHYGTLQLEDSKHIGTDFHIQYEPIGKSGYFPDLPDDLKEKRKYLFESNILANHYTFCPRGNGNHSLRYFETLAYGRIPVTVESWYTLPIYAYDPRPAAPYPHSSHISHLEQDILHFHQERDIVKAQNECREIFEKYFTSEAQTRYAKRMIDDYLGAK